MPTRLNNLLVTNAGKTDSVFLENIARSWGFLGVIRQGRSEVVSIYIEEELPAFSFFLKAAVFYCQIDIAKMLLDAGTDVNDDATKYFEDALQITPLYQAAFVGDIDLMELLLKAGADIDA